jgi:hypothetical protein
VTDAVCLVVSEERSEVASIVGGKISLWDQPEALQEKLKEWLGGPEIQVPTFQHFIEDFFIKNWKTKLAAFALVSICWLILAGQQEEKIFFSAGIRYANPPVDLQVSKDSTRTVDLKLSGRQSRIKSMHRQDVRVNVNLENLTPGVHHIRLSDKNLYLPSGIKVESITPQKIEVILTEQKKNSETDNSK